MGIVLRRRVFGLALALVLVLAPGLVKAKERHVTVDWGRGLLIVQSAVLGDLRAPTRALARVKSERKAREQGAKRIAAALGKVPVAGGRDLATRKNQTPSPKDVQKGLITLSTDYGADGSVVLQLAWPLDGLRRARFGADVPFVEDEKPSPTGSEKVLIVDATKLSLKPMIGLAIAEKNITYRGPTVFFTSQTQAKEAGYEVDGAPSVRAVRRAGARLIVEPSPDVALAARRGSLVVVLVRNLPKAKL